MKLKLQSFKIMDVTSIALLSLSILLGAMTFLFIFRIVLTWYPQVDLDKFPFNLIKIPTEIFLAPTRKIIQPLGGVDITPILWVGIFSLLRELLLGQQGIFTMMF
ncbi:YggT family protein [Leptolyngbya sp. AN03gr2]|uniref:YggT family protein n=1 Tax=unclassified Leptolyngbya TaxID=2650499 RepID=UPI003D3142C5